MPVRADLPDNNPANSSDASLPLHRSTYHSQALGRVQPYAYFAPPGFMTGAVPPAAVPPSSHNAEGRQDAAGTTDDTRFPLLILLHGLAGNHLTWATQTHLAKYAKEYNLFIAFPEGAEGWYTNSHDGAARYEDDLMRDFVPHLQSTLPLREPGRHWAIGGMSMGGHGAIKIALTYGRMFALGLAHSGAFEYPQRQPAHPVFGDPHADLATRRAANVFKLAEDALGTWPPARPNLYLDCGTEDRLLPNSRRFHQHLDFIGYRHTYIEQPGYHNLPYWDRAIRQALPTIVAAIGDP